MVVKYLEKPVDGNYMKMLSAVLNKSWKQQLTKQQLYSHLPPISQTIQVRWVRQVGHCWWSKDELISHVLQWTFTNGYTSVGCSVWTYIHHLYVDTGWRLEDLLTVMADRDKWPEREERICADEDDIKIKFHLYEPAYILIYINILSNTQVINTDIIFVAKLQLSHSALKATKNVC